MTGFRIAKLPALINAMGKPVGMIGGDGTEVYFPSFSADFSSLIKPDGTVLPSQGSGYVLQPATSMVLGGVKIGTGLTVAADGTISVPVSSGGTTPAAGASSGSARVVYTSSTCTSDADVSLGSTNLGSDQGAKLQAILDMAATGPLHVIWDGAYGVSPQFSDIALKIRSNTMITVLPNCGAILRDNSDSALIGNYDRNDGRGTGSSYPANGSGNKNIAIIGGMWNGNGSSFRIFQFFGVDQMLLRDNKLFNSRHFHFHCGNVTNLVIDNPYVDKGAGGGIFGDGLHVCGPARNVVINNAVVLRCGDDNVAFNADDAWVGNTETYQPRGPMNNIRLNGLYMESSLYGVRALSGGSSIDNLFIEKVRGTGSGYWLVIDNFIPAQTATTGPGAIGLIVIRDVDVVVSAGGDPNLKACAAIDCKIDRLVLDTIQRASAAGNDYASVRFGPKADIRQLIVERYMGSVALGGQLLFYAGSKVQTAHINHSVFDSPSAVSAYPIVVQSGATIGQLTGIGNTGKNFTDFVQNNGTITYLHFPAAVNFMDVPNAPSTWSLEQGFSEQSASAITYTGPGATFMGVKVARKVASDAFGGNIQLSDTIMFTGTAREALNAALLARGSNLQPYNGSTRQAYVLDVNKAGNVVTLQRSIGSTDTVIGQVTVSAGIAMNTAYNCTLTAKGSVISARMQRVSDGFYLQPNGTFAATAVDCCSGTDTGIPAASAQVGVYAYALNNDGSASGVNYTNFATVAAP